MVVKAIGEYDADAVARAIARATHRINKVEVTDAAAAAYQKMGKAPQALDSVQHWTAASAEVDAARAALREAQHHVRLVATEAAGNGDDDDLRAGVTARDDARRALITSLDAALALHTERLGEEQFRQKQDDVAALLECVEPTLTQRLRLERLRDTVLPELERWMTQIDGMPEERAAFAEHVEGTPPSMDGIRALQEALKKTKRKMIGADGELKYAEAEGDDTAEAEAELKAARRAVQSAERALHRARTELACIASAHFPEMLVREALLRIGAASGLDSEEAVRTLLVERALSDYDLDTLLSPAEGARHEVQKAHYDGETVVLKRYVLPIKSEWRALEKEVKLLRELAHCPYIADVQAVFVQFRKEPYAACTLAFGLELRRPRVL